MRSERLRRIPPYLFARLDRMKREVKNLIDLSIGDPDLPTPKHVIDELCRAVKDPAMHRYPPYEGIEELRDEIARYYLSKGVKLDPQSEVLVLIGSKEGIAHASLALLSDGERALVPSPSYPVYANSTILAGATPYEMPLQEGTWLPDLEIDARGAKLMFLNYPNNPTSAIATKSFFRDAVRFAEENDLVVLHDYAYGEITYGRYSAPSFLSVKGAKDVGVEFNSFSKTFNMAGWRIGFAVGNEEILRSILELKTHVDSGAFRAVQMAALAALRGPRRELRRTLRIYEKRIDMLCRSLRRAGLEFRKPRATFYIWARIPDGYTSESFCEMLLRKAGIAAAPGSGFGTRGEGYVRFSVTAPTRKIEEACERIERLT